MTWSAPTFEAASARICFGSTEMSVPTPLLFSRLSQSSPIGPAPYTTADSPGIRSTLEMPLTTSESGSASGITSHEVELGNLKTALWGASRYSA